MAREVVMYLIAALVFYWGLDRKRAEESITQKFALRDQRLDTLEQRMDDAAERSSHQASRTMTKLAEVSERLVRLEAQRGEVA